MEHSENKIIKYFETEVGLECSSPAFNKRTLSKEFTQKGQNQLITIGTCFVPMASCNSHFFHTLDWSTPGTISFLNIQDCIITLFLEYSLQNDEWFALSELMAVNFFRQISHKNVHLRWKNYYETYTETRIDYLLLEGNRVIHKSNLWKKLFNQLFYILYFMLKYENHVATACDKCFWTPSWALCFIKINIHLFLSPN